jgi:hypothetical protein
MVSRVVHSDDFLERGADMSTFSVFEEPQVILVAGGFDTVFEANCIAGNMRRDAGLKAVVSVLRPGDDDLDKQLDSDPGEGHSSFLNKHVLLGMVSVLFGALVATWLIALWPAAAASLLMSALFICSLGLFFGLIVGGLVSISPYQSVVGDKVREWLEQGRIAVVVHPIDETAACRAYDSLIGAGATPVRSF